MIDTDEKPHWKKLKDIIQDFGNGKAIIVFQDGLPVQIDEIEGEKKNINLTK